MATFETPIRWPAVLESRGFMSRAVPIRDAHGAPQPFYTRPLRTDLTRAAIILTPVINDDGRAAVLELSVLHPDGSLLATGIILEPEMIAKLAVRLDEVLDLLRPTPPEAA